MNTISIISSPFQLFSFSELIKQKNIKNYFLLALVYNDHESIQIKNLATSLEIKLSKIIFGKKVFQYFLIRKLVRKFRNIDLIVIGNFFSDPHLLFANEKKNTDIIFLDDGLNSRFIINAIEKTKKYPFFKLLFIKIFKFNLEYPQKFSIFTMFDLDSNNSDIQIEKNKLLNTKQKIKDLNFKGITILIGQPFIELSILNKKFYFKLVNSIKKLYPNFLYVPSRKENDKILEKMKKNININILRTDMNIEHYLLKNKIIPKRIIGFTSTALVSLDKIFNKEQNNIEIKSIRINDEIIEKNRPKFGMNYSFDKHYKLLDDFKIKSLKI